MTRQYLIVWDGPDKCGKTEMAKEYSRRKGIPYFKNHRETPSFDDPDYFIRCCEFVESFFLPYLDQTRASLIQDRSWPSEYVYSRVFARRRDDKLIKRLDSEFARLGTRIIIPHRSSYVGIEDDIATISPKLQQIHDLYAEFADWTLCKTLWLNVDDEDLEREMEEVEAFMGDDR